MPKWLKLSRVNNLLLTAIILINLYIIAAPFAPAVVFWWQKHHTDRESQLSQLVNRPAKQKTSSSNALSIPSQNTVVIPSMELNTPILEGSVRNEYKTLDQGVWRWPLGSTPDKGGNTVLVGHRFTYTNPRGIFYELNQVKINDDIAVFWSGKEYIYQTSNISVVSPNDVSILNQTSQPELTLYTCTPTWNPVSRLVVTAKLISTRSFSKS